MEFKVYHQSDGSVLLINAKLNEDTYAVVPASLSEELKVRPTLHTVHRFINELPKEVAHIQRDDYLKPAYQLYIGPHHEKVELKYPEEVRDHPRTTFHWRGRELTWEKDKELSDATTNEVIAEFKQSCYLKRVVFRQKGILTLYPTALRIRHRYDQGHDRQQERHGKASRFRKHFQRTDKEKERKDEEKESVMQLQERAEKEKSVEELEQLKIDFLVAVAVAMQFQWKHIRSGKDLST